MNRYRVNWTHILGASNTDFVYAINSETAKVMIENRQGANNLAQITVRPY
jgi:hypothetical protein